MQNIHNLFNPLLGRAVLQANSTQHQVVIPCRRSITGTITSSSSAALDSGALTCACNGEPLLRARLRSCGLRPQGLISSHHRTTKEVEGCLFPRAWILWCLLASSRWHHTHPVFGDGRTTK